MDEWIQERLSTTETEEYETSVTLGDCEREIMRKVEKHLNRRIQKRQKAAGESV